MKFIFLFFLKILLIFLKLFSSICGEFFCFCVWKLFFHSDFLNWTCVLCLIEHNGGPGRFKGNALWSIWPDLSARLTSMTATMLSVSILSVVAWQVGFFLGFFWWSSGRERLFVFHFLAALQTSADQKPVVFLKALRDIDTTIDEGRREEFAECPRYSS